ncbi:hypothetical protein BGW36DRAFT_18971 [Talaromyces proteolyticus]|uniref:3-beta hydroxysteroid dehydrogenase/isomerase domain-containing protein n=1 Tax=Talaromyces proteolyticus TaxID=1131652 RepID=A0AAD4Q6M5_9EURO|nr:uncharacterized protein BGW36DRAFT_18971 [Talaromyces proteolyticus]KAH8705866.1 hypothetical protein BGW36DRAFT_18971 [Talaromyces proteolyticus]
MATESYLVTGGCGLQGSHIVSQLLDAYPSAAIAVLSRNPTKNRFPRVTYHAGDVTQPSDVRRTLEASQPTVIFHCAGIITVGRKVVSEALLWSINLDGTRILLEECVAVGGVKAFVFTSSASVVQRVLLMDIFGGDETMELCEDGDKSAMPYSKSKAAAERLTHSYDDSSGKGMRTTSLRPALIYGERDGDIIPRLMQILRQGRQRIQVGPNTNQLSYTYAGNSATAHILAAQKLLTSPEGVAGESFFITNGGDPVAFWTFARAVWEAAGDRTKLEEVKVVGVNTALCFAWVAEWFDWGRGQVPLLSRMMVKMICSNRWFKIGKAREKLGWEPAVDWKEGVTKGVQWYLENEARQ